MRFFPKATQQCNLTLTNSDIHQDPVLTARNFCRKSHVTATVDNDFHSQSSFVLDQGQVSCQKDSSYIKARIYDNDLSPGKFSCNLI